MLKCSIMFLFDSCRLFENNKKPIMYHCNDIKKSICGKMFYLKLFYNRTLWNV